jgi:hypothetical protein
MHMLGTDQQVRDRMFLFPLVYHVLGISGVMDGQRFLPIQWAEGSVNARVKKTFEDEAGIHALYCPNDDQERLVRTVTSRTKWISINDASPALVLCRLVRALGVHVHFQKGVGTFTVSQHVVQALCASALAREHDKERILTLLRAVPSEDWVRRLLEDTLASMEAFCLVNGPPAPDGVSHV